MVTVEQVLRYVDLAPEQSSRLVIAVSIDNGRPVEPIRLEYPAGLAIKRVDDSDGSETWVLYFLRGDGGIIDFAQRPSLGQAKAEVGAVVTEDEWFDLNDEPFNRIPRERLIQS